MRKIHHNAPVRRSMSAHPPLWATLVASSLIIILSSSSALAQGGPRISSQDDRRKVLATVEQALDREDETFRALFADLIYPFRFGLLTEETVVTEVEEESVEEEPTISDEVVLQSVAAQLSPVGTLIRSNHQILILPGPDGRNRNVRQGEQFTARYRDRDHQITLKKVTVDEFTLALNDSTFTRAVFPIDDSRIRRD